MAKEEKPAAPLKFLRSIPEFIWPLIAVVIGGMLTWMPLHWQLEHDSRERERERQMSVRRDVYLSAAEKFGQQLAYLANFYNNWARFDNKTEPLPQGYLEAVARIQVIGSNETLAALNRFDDFVSEAFAELTPQIIELALLRTKFVRLSELTTNTQAEVAESVEQMKAYNLQGIKDDEKWSTIKYNTDMAQSRENKLMEELKKIAAELIRLSSDLAPKCLQKALPAHELLIPLMGAIRKELNLAFDEKAYRARMKASHSKWKENMEKLNATIRDKYDTALQAIEQDDLFDDE